MLAVLWQGDGFFLTITTWAFPVMRMEIWKSPSAHLPQSHQTLPSGGAALLGFGWPRKCHHWQNSDGGLLLLLVWEGRGGRGKRPRGIEIPIDTRRHRKNVRL